MGRGTMGQTCPHCHSSATIRTSKKVSDLVREYYISCNDIECGHSWKAQMSAIASITPSQNPNPNITLPMTTRGLNRLKKTDQLATAPPTG